jgi:thioesterase domain-containing protein
VTDADAPSLSAAKRALLAQRLRGRAPRQPDGPLSDAGLAPETAPLKLYYVVPHEAAMVALRHIASSLGNDYEVVGLLSGVLGKPFDRSVTVDSIADEVFAEIRLAQPHGPYFIMGYSLGGLVAYEVAGRLRAEGEIVDWLALLDSWEPETMRRGRVRSSMAQRRGHLLRRVVLRLRILLVRQLHRIHPLPFPSDEFDFVGARAIALRYTPVGHDAPLDVFSAESSVAVYGPSSGWDRLHKGELVAHTLPGSHNSVLGAPQAQVIAEVLSGRWEEIPAQELDGKA